MDCCCSKTGGMRGKGAISTNGTSNICAKIAADVTVQSPSTRLKSATMSNHSLFCLLLRLCLVKSCMNILVLSDSCTYFAQQAVTSDDFELCMHVITMLIDNAPILNVVTWAVLNSPGHLWFQSHAIRCAVFLSSIPIHCGFFEGGCQ